MDKKPASARRNEAFKAPPWTVDSHPELWVSLSYAAKAWFGKSCRWIQRSVKQGDFDGIFPTYFDGRRWRIRLPYRPTGTQESAARR